MRADATRLILNLLGNQVVWFVAVIAAGRGQAWPGVLAAFAFVALHLRSAPRPGDEIRLVVLAVLCGVVVDGVAAWQGWVVYRAATFGSAMAPPWILALWASLAVTAHTGMRSLQPHPWAAALLGVSAVPWPTWQRPADGTPRSSPCQRGGACAGSRLRGRWHCLCCWVSRDGR